MLWRCWGRDFTFFDWGMLIKVRWSKTIQFRKWVLEIPVARWINQELCAVYWNSNHIRELQAGPQEMAFRIPGHGGFLQIPLL